MNWLFDDKKTTMVITTKRIINKLAPISIVTHDRDDVCGNFLIKEN